MIRWKARRIPCASLLLSLAAVFVFACPSLAAPLQYDRAAIAAGEFWRVLSGHWVHYGFDHFFWDVLAFGCLGVACERRSRSRFLVCVVASAVAISLSVWFGLSGMSAYRGLSGIDSALLVLLFMELWSDAIRSGQPRQMLFPAVCLAAFVFKVSFELATGDTIFVKSLGSGMVGVPLAHVAGAAVGCLVGLAARGRNHPRAARHGECATETPRHREYLGFLRVSVPLWPMTLCLAGRGDFRHGVLGTPPKIDAIVLYSSPSECS